MPLCPQHVLLGALVAGVIIVSLAAVYARSIVRGAWDERAIVERGTARLRREIVAAWREVRDARRELARRLSARTRAP